MNLPNRIGPAMALVPQPTFIPELDHAGPLAHDHSVEWRSRYDGLVVIAHLDGKAAAGISGPWSGKYALTWWERPLPQRQLELFDSLEDAKREVESWALRMRNGYPSALAGAPANASDLLPMLVPVEKSGLLGQIRSLLPEFGRTRARSMGDREHDPLGADEVDLDGLHFAAEK